jgi:hypothetical protein
MAKRIVHLFEAIEVQENYGKRRLVAFCQSDGMLKAICE